MAIPSADPRPHTDHPALVPIYSTEHLSEEILTALHGPYRLYAMRFGLSRALAKFDRPAYTFLLYHDFKSI
jgi:hypothetical protein